MLSSLDDGVSWNTEAGNIPNTGSYTWTVPSVVTTEARLAIMVVYEVDEAGVVPESEFAVSDPFSIETPTGVDAGKASFALRPANPVAGPLTVSFSLTSADPALLAVYDVGGRKVVGARGRFERSRLAHGVARGAAGRRVRGAIEPGGPERVGPGGGHPLDLGGSSLSRVLHSARAAIVFTSLDRGPP